LLITLPFPTLKEGERGDKEVGNLYGVALLTLTLSHKEENRDGL